MENKLFEGFFQDVKNVFTIVKLKEYLKLPVYTYIICFAIGLMIPITSILLNPGAEKVAVTHETFGLGTSLTWSFIIKNNILVLFTLFITGIILYIGPLFGLGFNSLVHGLLLGTSIQDSGINGIIKYLLLMGPHGIFEIPALLFGTAAGLVLSRTLLNWINLKYFNTSRLYEAFLLIFIAFCLFLIASVIETQVTFKVFDLYMSHLSNNSGIN